MKDPRDVIIRPVFTEEANDKAAMKVYTFEVDRRANKIEIARAIEDIFDVKVDNVHTMNVKGKPKRVGRTAGYRRNWKKAIIKLTDDSHEISMFSN